jgi:hypothetical protein
MLARVLSALALLARSDAAKDLIFDRLGPGVPCGRPRLKISRSNPGTAAGCSPSR